MYFRAVRILIQYLLLIRYKVHHPTHWWIECTYYSADRVGMSGGHGKVGKNVL
jgi:hypothetical protein